MMHPSLSIQSLLDFINHSPTPYHAVENMAAVLKSSGFKQLFEQDDWQLAPQQSYFVIRNNGAICAWHLPDDIASHPSIRIVGAHTDSPCLKIKPLPELQQHGVLRLAVEVYGSALLSTWFDRDLSIAGRVVINSGDNQLKTMLIDFKRPLGIIPNLAIHLNRTANSQHSIDHQNGLPIVLCVNDSTQETIDFKQLITQQIHQQYPELGEAIDLVAVEMFAYDTQPAMIAGLNEEFISASRLDNLLSCFIGLQALVDSSGSASQQFSMLICNDHEEVGSRSSSGANSCLLKSTLQRIIADPITLHRLCQNSLCISADNAHALHPNFPSKHDQNHGPLINAGPVIKSNSNQSYATNALGSSWINYWAQQKQLPIQHFVTRNDMGCGSTIGPIMAAQMGINTVDIGVPQWAMHSIRETAGHRDSDYLYQLLSAFYQHSGTFSIASV